MPTTYSQLNLDERRLFDRMHNEQNSIAEISRTLGRHRSTIYRELRRNRFVGDEMSELKGYYCMTALDKAGDRSARRTKLIRHIELREAVIDRLNVGWSPEQIAGRLGYEQSDLPLCS